MRDKWTRVLLCVVVVAFTSLWALGQDDTSNKSKGEVRKITGCLTKSGSGDEYLLTATDGSTWEIHENNAVNLASHVNQTVDLKGVVSNEKMHNMPPELLPHPKHSGHVGVGRQYSAAQDGLRRKGLGRLEAGPPR